LSIWQLSNGGLTAEKAEIVLNGNDTETFLSMREPDDKPGGVSILLASLNRLFAMERSR
jgi:hypothetical protein